MGKPTRTSCKLLECGSLRSAFPVDPPYGVQRTEGGKCPKGTIRGHFGLKPFFDFPPTSSPGTPPAFPQNARMASKKSFVPLLYAPLLTRDKPKVAKERDGFPRPDATSTNSKHMLFVSPASDNPVGSSYVRRSMQRVHRRVFFTHVKRKSSDADMSDASIAHERQRLSAALTGQTCFGVKCL